MDLGQQLVSMICTQMKHRKYIGGGFVSAAVPRARPREFVSQEDMREIPLAAATKCIVFLNA